MSIIENKVDYLLKMAKKMNENKENVGNKGTNSNKSIDEIQQLLQKAPLSEINVRSNKRPNLGVLSLDQATKKPKFNALFSPNTKKILDPLTPISKEKIRRQIRKDDMKIDYHNDDECNPDYQEEIRAQILGKKMESSICAHCRCPNCGSKFLLIDNPIFPAVDLKCDCKWWQVKVSIGSTGYFSKRRRVITVGSTRYGSAIHTANYQSDDKIILGYICVVVDLTTNTHVAKINYPNSFVLIPDSTKNVDGSAYQYKSDLTYFGKSQITWNTDIVQEFGLETIFPVGFREIKLDEEYDLLSVL